jgi:hypothetical protein
MTYASTDCTGTAMTYDVSLGGACADASMNPSPPLSSSLILLFSCFQYWYHLYLHCFSIHLRDGKFGPQFF